MRKRLLQTLVLLLLAAAVGVAWQVLSTLSNDTRPLVAGRPLSNPHTHLHTMAPPTRLVTDSTGKDLYAISGQELWFSGDAGTSWQRRFHFERGDLIAFLVDRENPNHLYAGFYLPAEVVSTTDGGRARHVLTD